MRKHKTGHAKLNLILFFLLQLIFFLFFFYKLFEGEEKEECLTYRAAFDRSNCGHTVFGGVCMCGCIVRGIVVLGERGKERGRRRGTRLSPTRWKERDNGGKERRV